MSTAPGRSMGKPSVKASGEGFVKSVSLPPVAPSARDCFSACLLEAGRAGRETGSLPASFREGVWFRRHGEYERKAG